MYIKKNRIKILLEWEYGTFLTDKKKKRVKLKFKTFIHIDVDDLSYSPFFTYINFFTCILILYIFFNVFNLFIFFLKEM